MHTYTFQEEVTDLAEAKRRYAPIDDWYRRHGVQHIDTWEIQPERYSRTGVAVWHNHSVVDQWCDVRELRAFSVARGWGTQSPQIDVIGRGIRHKGWTVEGAIRYLSKYLTKEKTTLVPKGARLTGRVAARRMGSTRFGWLNGYGRLWRNGIELFARIEGRLPKWCERAKVVNYALGYIQDFWGQRIELAAVIQYNFFVELAFSGGPAPPRGVTEWPDGVFTFGP